MILIVYTFNASAESSQPAACVCQDLHTKFTPDTAEEIFAKSVDLKLGWTKDIKSRSFHLLSKTNIYSVLGRLLWKCNRLQITSYPT